MLLVSLLIVYAAGCAVSFSVMTDGIKMDCLWFWPPALWALLWPVFLILWVAFFLGRCFSK
jgi:hypothetical protein